MTTDWKEGLHAELRDTLVRLLHRCADHSQLGGAGLTVVITEGRRPDWRQALYFCQGRTPSEIAAELDAVSADQACRQEMAQTMAGLFGPTALPETRAPGRIVTNALPFTGPHCLGVAAHFGIKRGPRMLYPDAPWEVVGRIAQQFGLVWGGAWPMKDMAHVELPKTLWPKPDREGARLGAPGAGGWKGEAA